MFVFRDSATRPSAAGANAAEAFAGGSTELVYADFAEARDLHRLDLASDADEIVGEMSRSGNTEAAPGSTWLSIEVAAGTGDQFHPEIFLYDPESDEEVALGVAYEPFWSADGSRLAFVAPDDPSSCNEEECRGPRKVMVVEASGSDPEELTASGEYNLLGWAGDYVVVLNEDTPGSPIAQTVSPAGDIQDLPMLPREFWGASPDGRWIIQTGDSGTKFLAVVDGRADAEGPDIAIPAGTTLGSGAWSHDSSLVAASALGDDGALEIVTFSPDDPEPRPIAPGGESSIVGVLWSPDNDAFVFQRFTGEELEAVHCPIADPDACRVLFAWTRGISLLRIE
jgi:hypothetical protein